MNGLDDAKKNLATWYSSTAWAEWNIIIRGNPGLSIKLIKLSRA
jgi:hypothetical protein